MNYIIFSQNKWNSALKYQRHRLAEYLAKKPDTELVVFVSRISVKDMRNIFTFRMLRRLLSALNVLFFQSPLKLSRGKPENVVTISACIYPYQLRIMDKLIFFPLLIRRISKVLDDAGPGVRIIAYQPIPYLPRLKTILSASSFIYVTVHDFENIPGVNNRVPKEELSLIASSDHAVTDSEALAEKLLDPSANLMAPACDLSVVKKSRAITPRIPEELKSLVYFGTIAPYLSYFTLQELHRIGIDLKFVGKLSGISKSFITSRLGGEIFPPLDFESASKYLRTFDGTILPYEASDRNENIIPAKIFECLALGIPVFVPRMRWSTGTSLGEALYIYDSTEELLKLVRGFDPNLFRNKRRIGLDIAADNSWDARFSDLFECFSWSD